MTGLPQTVFVVDDEPSVRTAVGRLLAAAGYTVETFASATEFLARSRYHGVGCIVLDLRMPGNSGFDLQEELAANGCLLPIIFMSGQADIPASVRALKAGAQDFLAKPFTDAELLTAVALGLTRCRERLQNQTRHTEILNRLACLTPRERQVLDGVVAGKLNKQIAAELGTVEKTVKVHRGRMMRKMRAQSVADLVRMVEKNLSPLSANSPGALGPRSRSTRSWQSVD